MFIIKAKGSIPFKGKWNKAFGSSIGV